MAEAPIEDSGARVGAGDRFAVLGAFQRAVAREVHTLSRDPEIVWPQLFNRLQWEDHPVSAVVAAELERRTAAGARGIARQAVRASLRTARVPPFARRVGRSSQPWPALECRAPCR